MAGRIFLILTVGMTAASVPAPGEVVYLRSTANLSTGGTATDVTDIIHPDNRDMAVRAVRDLAPSSSRVRRSRLRTRATSSRGSNGLVR